MYDRIEKLRKEQNISPEELELVLRLPVGSYEAIKTGMPMPDRLQKIADYFGVSMKYLLVGEEPKNTQQFFSDSIMEIAWELQQNYELLKLFELQRKMKPYQLRTLYDMTLDLKWREHRKIEG